MRIIIVGGGVVGSALAEHLLRDGHQLAMIERDPKLSKQIGDKQDLQVLTGSGSSPWLLCEAGIEDADMVLAVTPVDEVNMVVCAIAAQYDVGQRVARLRGREFTREDSSFDLSRIGVTSIIHPEKVMVDHILQFIETPHAVESANFEDGRILMRGYRVRDNMPLAGKTPREIRQEIEPEVLLFAAVDRGGEGVIPDGNLVIQPDDIIYALFPRECLDTFMGLVGQGKKKHRKVIVTGDSFAIIEMAQGLQDTDHKVTVVHPELEGAKKVAGMFDGIDVLHGDCTDADFLRELNVGSASFFVSVSDQSDYNVLSALLAKAEGAHEVIAISTEGRHHSLFTSIGIDHVINPRLTAAREILESVSRGGINAAVELSNIDIEAVRFTVAPKSGMAGQKVKKIARKLKKGSIIGVVVREDRMILPGGETVIEENDHVIVITHSKHLDAISKLFTPRS
ncbi:MAG: Trk system potassium transporter TrkA [Candidatus Zixiibacteriota bacterium]|nr:MAG: Trk system potassium transporter TrkA [candidate division Zixibacteria bacterium]